MNARWPLTTYTDKMPDGVAGDARGPFIRIRKGYEADEGLYQHELRHVKQWALVGPVLGLANGAAAWFLAPVGGLTPMQAALVLGIAAAIGGHGLLYLLVTAYRRAVEVDAYVMQMLYSNGRGGALTLDDAAERLSRPNYRLGITVDQARETLRDRMVL